MVSLRYTVEKNVNMNKLEAKIVLFIILLSNAVSAQIINADSKVIPLFGNDSIKIATIRLSNFDESTVIHDIENILNNMDYDIISAKLPIKTDRFEAYRVKDTIKFWFIRLDIIDYPVLVSHDISLATLSNGRVGVWLKSFVFVKDSDTEENIEEAKKIGQRYLRKEFKRALRKELNNITDE